MNAPQISGFSGLFDGGPDGGPLGDRKEGHSGPDVDRWWTCGRADGGPAEGQMVDLRGLTVDRMEGLREGQMVDHSEGLTVDHGPEVDRKVDRKEDHLEGLMVGPKDVLREHHSKSLKVDDWKRRWGGPFQQSALGLEEWASTIASSGGEDETSGVEVSKSTGGCSLTTGVERSGSATGLRATSPFLFHRLIRFFLFQEESVDHLLQLYQRYQH